MPRIRDRHGQRFRFIEDLIFSPPRGWKLRATVLGATWHFDPCGGLWAIRHVPSGLTCQPAPREHDGWALEGVAVIDARGDWPKAPELALIGLAARFAGVHASLLHAARGLTGAIYLSYPQPDAGDDPFVRPRLRRARPLSPLRSTRPPRTRAEARFRNVLPSFLLEPRSEGKSHEH